MIIDLSIILLLFIQPPTSEAGSRTWLLCKKHTLIAGARCPTWSALGPKVIQPGTPAPDLYSRISTRWTSTFSSLVAIVAELV